MARDNILLTLRKICSSFVDEHGNMRVRPIGFIENMKVEMDRQELLKDIVILLKDTDIINRETKMYIFNNTTKREINEVLSEEVGETVSFNTTQSKIQYGKTKLEKLFGDSIKRLLYKTYDIDDIPRLIYDISSQYSDIDLRNKLVLDLDSNVYNTELSENDFEDFILTIAPYVKTQVEYISKNIESEKVGYFNYLITSKRLTDEDKQRLSKLKDILNNE